LSRHKGFVAGEVDTDLIQRDLASLTVEPEPDDKVRTMAVWMRASAWWMLRRGGASGFPGDGGGEAASVTARTARLSGEMPALRVAGASMAHAMHHNAAPMIGAPVRRMAPMISMGAQPFPLPVTRSMTELMASMLSRARMGTTTVTAIEVDRRSRPRVSDRRARGSSAARSDPSLASAMLEPHSGQRASRTHHGGRPSRS
jgi:hypothetical protein